MIRNDIASGRLSKDEKLPSKRSFAEHLGTSVITIEYAYRLLIDEGYIYAKERSGYYVSNLNGMPPSGERNSSKDEFENSETDFDADFEPEFDFPFSAYSKIVRKTLPEYGERLLMKPPHNGCAVLRNAISGYLLRYRGMSVPADRIVVGSGAEYLYGMIVQLLGRDIIYGLENPSYEKIEKVYEANGAVCRLLSMDRYGIDSNELINTNASVIHVTPFHSYPTGITAPAKKRFEYLSWAERTGGIVIEDDFASEFAVNSKPVETIYSMDKNDSVIYINTFSKTLAPSMRMGYMILPEHLSYEYEKKLGFYSSTVPVLDQYVLAEFINEGYFERHLNRTRRKLKNK
ncbi:MAG: PLP-dependent aminotransferase family protein [Clostridiales bacterium]|nr:PLP-dependent aminotransferase family protein [Clostridiales bacterium]